MNFPARCCEPEHDLCDPCCVCGEPEGLNDPLEWVVVNPSRHKKRRKIENPWPQEKRG
ncbi:hypothetical protein [Mycobacterium phage WXIN]|nr:hypothetical protein [Mycobacterium phage WXIN]